MSGTILVADDDLAILDSLKLMLELEQYSVITTSDGKVHDYINQHKPDILLLDIWMSGVDGKEVCKSLKANETTKHISVILISASQNIQESKAEAGADDYLEKPFELDELLQKIKRYVERKRSIQSAGQN